MLWGHIYLTPALAALTHSAPFMRLHRIMQLGPAFMVYPGATHTRASHSIGVYHLARRLLSHLAEQGADAWLSAEGVKSFLCAALLHDLGHFPYTHSLKELPLKDHERLTASLVTSEPVKSLVAAAGGDPYMAAAIVDTSMQASSMQASLVAQAPGDGELLFYRRLLSGALDPDKLDYLSRDGRYCGVPYGAQDVDFIFSRLQPDKERGVVIDSRGIPAVESLLFSKYLMYRAVYWHKAVRAATSMVKKALLAALHDKTIAAEELYNLDDQGLFTLAAGRDHALSGLVNWVSNGRFFTVAAEIPFDKTVHGEALCLSARARMEESLADELSACLGKPLGRNELIIDLPEPVSFESGLFVTDENCLFSDASGVFKDNLLDAFTKSLRTIRIFVDPRFEDDIENAREGILRTVEKWLTLCKGSEYGTT